jgi:hypothetical protein
VITWKDFILDDVVGPIMNDAIFESSDLSCRVTSRLGSPIVMEDVTGAIQETGQEQRPARMVGLSHLDSCTEPHMEVSSEDQALESPRLRGEA